jgi:hypothetical protein
LPLAVFPHPDICEANFSAKGLAIFVCPCLMVIPIANREVLAIHTQVKGHNTRTGERVGIILEESESVFSLIHFAVVVGIGKIVCPNPSQVIKIFGDVNFAPLFRESRKLFRDLFCFVSRYRRLRGASGF